eukprot:TRINITY_DN5963_c0_g2_i1.p1 TRINITY_DN5963_c0_g2~~TRINITY_DN5963_c0_g2_i1.p1  ORF type:complete len:418 (-),score=62.83 TRINITY_DN5963_c0_g2_i1:72-1325(-)
MRAAVYVFGVLALFAICLVATSQAQKLPDWAFCTTSSQCQDNCCSKQYSNDGKLKCTPGGSPNQCVHSGGKGHSWAGSNLYYAAGLTFSEQEYLFSNLRRSGVRVLRVWLDGQTQGSTKNTKPFRGYPDLEHSSIGQYDDTVLNYLDAVMIEAHRYGIKLLISMYSFNALDNHDIYSRAYGVSGFYERSDAQSAFDNRIRHVLNHQHSTLKQPWKVLKDYIFAFEAQNEAMIGLGQGYIASHQGWQCDRANTIRSVIGSNSGILITTGGESWLEESMQPDFFSCPSLDIIAIHAYGLPGDLTTDRLMPYVNKALASGKRLIVQEWGACYFNTDNNNCPSGGVLNRSTRDSNIRNWADAISAAGVPWMYWQILPNNDPHYGTDYEIGINDVNWSTWSEVANNTQNYSSHWDWSPYLLY